jgi:predicted enzyme related to lactoylglutathione lyase
MRVPTSHLVPGLSMPADPPCAIFAQPDARHVSRQFEKLDATKSKLEAAGAVILFELRHANTRGMPMHDPDGNEVALQDEPTK